MTGHIIANEAFQKGILVQGIDEKLHGEFFDMWENDLNCAFETMEEMVNHANSILDYYRSPLLVLAVDWDEKNCSFIWLLTKKNKSTL